MVPVAQQESLPREPIRSGSRGSGLLMGLLIALLLAVAAGLGTAALVQSRDSTWEATSVVTLLTGPQPSVNSVDALAGGQDRYVDKVANASFTAQAALKAGMPDDEVRDNITARRQGGEALAVVASASSSDGALALADAAGVTLVATVVNDQALASPPGDRLGATVSGPSTTAERTTPSATSVLLVGLLAGVAVLLLAGVVLVVGRRRKS